MDPTIICSTLSWSLSFFLSLSAAESYSVAGGEGSIPPSAGCVPHQGSRSSSPCSHSSSGGSRHPVSALKKWLTNPVRKLSSDARAVGKVDKQTCNSGKGPPSLLSHNETQPRPLEPPDDSTILPSGDTVRLPVRQATFTLRTLINTFHIAVYWIQQLHLVQNCSVRAIYQSLTWQRHTQPGNTSLLASSLPSFCFSSLFYSSGFYSYLLFSNSYPLFSDWIATIIGHNDLKVICQVNGIESGYSQNRIGKVQVIILFSDTFLNCYIYT